MKVSLAFSLRGILGLLEFFFFVLVKRSVYLFIYIGITRCTVRLPQ